MTVTEAGVASPAQLAAELEGTLDERTREILERRRRSVGRAAPRLARAARARDGRRRRPDRRLRPGGLALRRRLVDGDRRSHRPRTETLLFMLTLPGWVVVAKLYGLYDRDEERTDHSTVDDFGGVFHMITVGAWVLFSGRVAHEPRPSTAPQADRVLGLRDPARVHAARDGARVLPPPGRIPPEHHHRRRRRRRPADREEATSSTPSTGSTSSASSTLEPKERRPDLGHLPLLGSPDELPSSIRTFDVERVIIAFSNDRHEETLDLIRALKDLDVQVDIVPRLFELVGPGVADAHRRGAAAPRPRAAAPLPLVAAAQADARPRRWRSRHSSCSRRFSRSIAMAIKLDSRGPGLLPAGADGARMATFRICEVPDDGRRRRGAEGRRSRTSTSTSLRAATRGCSRSRTTRA